MRDTKTRIRKQNTFPLPRFLIFFFCCYLSAQANRKSEEQGYSGAAVTIGNTPKHEPREMATPALKEVDVHVVLCVCMFCYVCVCVSVCVCVFVCVCVCVVCGYGKSYIFFVSHLIASPPQLQYSRLVSKATASSAPTQESSCAAGPNPCCVAEVCILCFYVCVYVKMNIGHFVTKK